MRSQRRGPPSRLALFDPSSLVRTVAQFELTRAGVDVVEAYREAVADAHGASLATVLNGLAECGAAAEAPFPLAHVHDRSPLVRCDAIRALARLSPEPNVSVFLAALTDPSSRVVSAACDALSSRPHVLSSTTLLPVLEQGGAKRARRSS